MKNILVVIFILCTITGTAHTNSRNTKKNMLPALKVSGNAFINEKGEIVRLTGVSFPDPDKLERDGQWNLRYFKEAKAWGCNVVRLPVHPYTWRYRGTDKYIELLDKGIEWATLSGMYVIIDWHAIGNLPEAKFPSYNYATTWKEIVKFWQTIAKKYKDNTTVAFYELFNEPTNQGAPLNWNSWKVTMEKLIDEITPIDNEKIYLVAGMNWAYLLDEVIGNPVNRTNVAYVTHPYPQKREQPWETKWDKDWGNVAAHYPVVATEFGYVVKGERGEHAPVIGDETYGKAIIEYFDKKGISYTVWCFDPHWSPAMLDDYDFTPSPHQGKFFKDILQKRR